MINDGINDVPESTIAVFMKTSSKTEYANAVQYIKKPNKKRGWFTNHFYRCLPLSIANQYGFVITLPYDLEVSWNGGNEVSDLIIKGDNYDKEDPGIYVSSQFGHGILTIATPFFLKTPKGINIMTINPPNFVLPNMTVMSGVVETDNIRQSFTFNVKLQMPDITTIVKKGTPICGFIPIKRYFADKFELKNAADIFEENIIKEEIRAESNHSIVRHQTNHKSMVDGSYESDSLYMRGMDVYGNTFEDHQKP